MNSVEQGGIGMTSLRTRGRLVARLREEGITHQAVLDAILETPRHLFVDEAMAHRAYEDTALPIGFAQTLSQPYVVARMTEILLQSGSVERVLEIGTGSGYQTAILTRWVKQLYSVERVGALLKQAQQRLRRLRLTNVQLRHGDGLQGWAEHAPFDAIIVTAAPPEVPEVLLQQLAKDGGRLIIPVGQEQQQLQLIVRHEHNYDCSVLEAVKFVPLLSGCS